MPMFPSGVDTKLLLANSHSDHISSNHFGQFAYMIGMLKLSTLQNFPHKILTYLFLAIPTKKLSFLSLKNLKLFLEEYQLSVVIVCGRITPKKADSLQNLINTAFPEAMIQLTPKSEVPPNKCIKMKSKALQSKALNVCTPWRLYPCKFLTLSSDPLRGSRVASTL